MKNANRFWSQKVKDLEPYVPGEQPKEQVFIKLNTNENPYGPSPEVEQVLLDYPKSRLRLYPDPQNQTLREALADYYDLRPEQIFAGNGSDEILAFAFFAFFTGRQSGKNAHIRFFDITYSFYPVYAKLYDIPYKLIKLGDNLEIDVKTIPTDGDGLIIANPNAPTGLALSLTEIEMLLTANRDRLVLVDEAYVDFGADSAIPLLSRYDNLLIVQTFSKSRALAGLRAGYAMGSPALIEALQRTRDSINSYTVNSLTQAAATAAVKSASWFRKTCSDIIKTRSYAMQAMAELGFELTDSMTNFVFARHPDYDARDLADRLRSQGILVRHFKQPRIDQYLRISIGTLDDMKVLITKLEELISNSKI